MARTTRGAQLTQQHKRAQLTVRALTLRALARLWPIWRGDERTFRLLVDALTPLVERQHGVSAALAASYFDAFRAAEGAAGTARALTPGPPDPQRVAGTLYLLGRTMTRDAVAAGQSPDAALRSAFVRTSGTVGTLVLEGGRATLLRSVAGDPDALGYARVASASCCAFCAMLASRGAAYGDESAGFQAHDHCACTAEPAYDGAALPPNSEAFRRLWDLHAKPAGAHALQAFRRALAEGHAEAVGDGAPSSSH
jgi:hypothetical protein